MDSNVTRQSWASRLLGSLVGACFGVFVGASSRDIRLTGKLSV